jgi:hypothetical protein
MTAQQLINQQIFVKSEWQVGNTYGLFWKNSYLDDWNLLANVEGMTLANQICQKFHRTNETIESLKAYMNDLYSNIQKDAEANHDASLVAKLELVTRMN